MNPATQAAQAVRSIRSASVLAVAVAYTLLRKRLADVWAVFVGLLPAPVQGRLPERFAEL